MRDYHEIENLDKGGPIGDCRLLYSKQYNIR